MRVRLYEVGDSRNGNIFRIDEFPARLALDDSGSLQTDFSNREPACLLEDRGGEIFVQANDENQSVGINDAEVEYGPLFPGDKLRLGERRFLVSYEQTPCEYSHSIKVRIRN